ncbi:MAG: beta-ketoacyl-ACP synthase II [Bacteroidia bacterium]|nr:beta-ketoacyl-ACP synthase II [Bacteroidia bacterium]MDW8345867.1 beta-ketoacyl-ACP synthase II [Bacteroidia bacterium]
MKTIAITGIGIISPIGNSVSEFLESIKKGISGANLITKFDASAHKTKFACEIKNFKPETRIDKKDLRKMDLYTQYALYACAEAIEQAQLQYNTKIDKNSVGVIWGSANGGVSTYDQEMLEFAKTPQNPRFSPFFIPKMLINMASGWISMKYGFGGIVYNTVSACASGNSAIIEAANQIRYGKAKVMIAGASEAPITPSHIAGFNALKALSTQNEHFQSASCPLDKNRDGFVMGEGAACLVLEEYEHAISRGAAILAEFAGGAMTADAYHITATHPEGQGAIRCMQQALSDAKIQPEQIDYLNMHATSTPLGDNSEVLAIKKVFKNHVNKLFVSATKSMTGHLLGAAGALETLICVLAVHHGFIPPTINTKELDEDTYLPNLVLNNPILKPIRYAMSNNFGFGGHNATVIIKKY